MQTADFQFFISADNNVCRLLLPTYEHRYENTIAVSEILNLISAQRSLVTHSHAQRTQSDMMLVSVLFVTKNNGQNWNNVITIFSHCSFDTYTCISKNKIANKSEQKQE